MRHDSPTTTWFTILLCLAILVIGSALGCGSGEPEPARSDDPAAQPPGERPAASDATRAETGPSQSDVYRAGAELAAHEQVKLAAVVADPQKYQGSTVRIEGEIEQVCLKKGCWMILRDGEASVRVTFKDYGFFVPTDTKPGSIARIDAEISVETLSEEIARHYEEETDGGDPETIQGPQEGVAIVATGVEIDL